MPPRQLRLGALTTLLLLVACNGEGADPTAEGHWASSASDAGTPGIAWDAIRDLKEAAGPGLRDASDAQIALYQDSLARFYGATVESPSARVGRRLAADDALDRALSQEQVAAWLDLDRATHGLGRVAWSASRRAPTMFDLPAVVEGDDIAQAQAHLEDQLLPALRRALGASPMDQLVERWSTEYPVDDGVGGAETYQVAQRRYGREVDGVVVWDDWVSITLRQSDRRSLRWDVRVTTHWTNREAMPTTPQLSASDAASAALGHAGSANARVLGEVSLGVDTLGTEAALTWRVRVQSDEGQTVYRISAEDGSALRVAPLELHADGTLQVRVARPYDSSKVARPLPNATIYEDYARYTSNPVDCWGNEYMDQWTGNTSRVLGSTGYDGSYSGVTAIDPSDTSWVVDYRGDHVRDISQMGILDLDTFPAGGTHTFPQSTFNARSRRGEVYYLLNYARQQYQIAYGTTQPSTIHFAYEDRPGTTECSSPVDAENCCGGKALFDTSCLQMWCWNAGIDAHPSAERWFRAVPLHEHNHVMRIDASGILLASCSTSGSTGSEMGCWEEGRAWFAGTALTRFESSNTSYRPDRRYPDDFTGEGIYDAGSVWTALYSKILLNIGVSPALKQVNFDLSQADSNTVMVGACTDLNGDSHIVPSECPTNSFYRQSLDADAAMWAGRYENQFEISESYHWHVTDADRVAAGAQSFPWADETPNHRTRPMFLAVESGGVKSVSEGGPTGSGSLRLGGPDDYDTFMFLARGGETYLIETTGLASGMDTYLEVLDRTGLETILVTNDDCSGSGPRSCATFTAPAGGGFYRVRVSSVFGAQTGPSKTYTLQITRQADDYGDSLDDAHAYPAGWWKGGKIDSSSDSDVFKIHSSGTQTAKILACPTSGVDPVRVEVLDAASVVLGSLDFSSCSSQQLDVGIGLGTYFLRVSSPSGTTGTYQFGAYPLLDEDVDGTAANAMQLVADGRKGRVYGGRFSSSSEEDWYSFEASEEGGFVLLETFEMASGVDTEIEIYTPSGTVFGRTGPLEPITTDTSGQGLGHWMLQDDDGAVSPRGSRLAFLTPVLGTYYVRVRNVGTSSGWYSLLFEDTGLRSGWHALP